MASTSSNNDKGKVYYSARGGARSRGAGNAARANAATPPQSVLEAPLPRDTTSHFARGGEGNEWDYATEDGVLKHALEMDIVRVQAIRWEHYRVAKTGLRGGARIPHPKKGDEKPKRVHRFLFKRKDDSIASFEIGNLSMTSPSSPTDPVNSLQERLFELSIASSDEVSEFNLSDFTAPSFIIADNDAISEHSSFSINSGSLTPTRPTSSIGQERRVRSPSISSLESEESFSISEASASSVGTYGRFSLIRPGVLVFKPDEPQPLVFNDVDTGGADFNLASKSTSVAEGAV